jgi:hypothetical protein
MSHIPIIAASLVSGMGAAFAVAMRCRSMSAKRRTAGNRPFWIEVGLSDEARKRPGESLAAMRARRAAEELGRD